MRRGRRFVGLAVRELGFLFQAVRMRMMKREESRSGAVLGTGRAAQDSPASSANCSPAPAANFSLSVP